MQKVLDSQLVHNLVRARQRHVAKIKATCPQETVLEWYGEQTDVGGVDQTETLQAHESIQLVSYSTPSG